MEGGAGYILIPYDSMTYGGQREAAAETRKNGQSARSGLPIFVHKRGRGAKIPNLGEVVAERGEHHVVDAFGRDGCTAGWHTTRAGPSILSYVGVLHTKLKAAL